MCSLRPTTDFSALWSKFFSLIKTRSKDDCSVQLTQNSSVLIWSDLVSWCKHFNLWTYLTLMILLKINDNCICCSKYLLFPLSLQSKQYWAIPVGGDWPSKPSCEIDYKLGRQKKKSVFWLEQFSKHHSSHPRNGLHSLPNCQSCVEIRQVDTALM